jgi:hypothetical protein
VKIKRSRCLDVLIVARAVTPPPEAASNIPQRRVSRARRRTASMPFFGLSKRATPVDWEGRRHAAIAQNRRERLLRGLPQGRVAKQANQRRQDATRPLR